MKHLLSPLITKPTHRGLLLAAAMALCAHGISQQSYTFTNCGATGSVGPTQAQVNTAYAATNLSSLVVISPTAGIQTWTVPVTGGYRIEARGAKGFGTNGGRGASIAGDFTLTAGTVLKILVGQQGAPPNSPGTNQYGGGGGTYVTSLANVPYVVAGGGGGSWATTYTGLSDGTVSINGNAGTNGPTNGAGGVAGGGGGTAGSADGGGGFTGNGGGTTGGLAFVNGGTGGSQYGHGGFGGGGGGSSWDNRRGCGGGGYSGGGGAGSTTTGFPEGGGGGSINNGVNQTNISGANNGNGRVVITELCSISLTAASSSTPANSICSGSSVTLTTNAVSNYNWSNGNTTSSSIVVTPTATTTYSLSGTSAAACTAFAFITVTVSGSAPVLTVAQTTNNICLGQAVTFTASGALTYTWSGGITNAVAFTPTSTSVYTVSGQNGCGTTIATASVTISPLAVSAITTSSVLCAGSLATLSAFAAANAYTWQPTSGTGTSIIVSPASTTVYTVTASNGTCIGVGNVSISTIANPTLTATASATNICAGNTVTLSASGANSYTWFPGNISGQVITVNPTAPIQYSVGGTNAQGCSAGASQVVIVNPAPNINVQSSDVIICDGGTATLSVTGGGNANYLWSNNATTSVIIVSPTTSSTYTVDVTDNLSNCITTGTISVDVFTPTVTVAGSSAICSGETATLQASGANSYTWSTGATVPGISVSPANTTVYTLTALSNSASINCAATGSFQVLVRPNPNVSATADRTVACRNETVVVSATGANSYVWSNGATTPSIAVTSSLVTTTLLNVTGTDQNGCKGSTSIIIQVNGCNGLANVNATSLRIYPNPAVNAITISTGNSIELNLYSQTGALVKTVVISSPGETKLDLSSLSNGIYYVVANDGNNQLKEKLIIHH